jgi:aminomethyltransferase
VVVNASNTQKDYEWMKEHIGSFDIIFTDVSPLVTRFAFQGPKAEEWLNPLVEADLTAVKRFFNLTTSLNTAKGPIEVFIARTGYTGEDGFEVTSAAKDGELLYKALLDTGAEPAGLGARDICRLEACYSLYGHELSNQITPIEASIGFAVKKKDGIDFIGKDVLMKQKAEGTPRKIVGLDLIDKGILRENFKIFKGGQEIGYVTSGGYSPTLKKTIGLGMIKVEYTELGTEVEIQIRSTLKRAKIVTTPFLQN